MLSYQTKIRKKQMNDMTSVITTFLCLFYLLFFILCYDRLSGPIMKSKLF